MQYAIANDTVYVLEANPRASRTVPLVSKVCNIQMARAATQLMLEASSANSISSASIPHFGVKESVFPSTCSRKWTRFSDRRCAPPARSWDWADSFGLAFYKAEQAAQTFLPLTGKVLITVADRDKPPS